MSKYAIRFTGEELGVLENHLDRFLISGDSAKDNPKLVKVYNKILDQHIKTNQNRQREVPNE